MFSIPGHQPQDMDMLVSQMNVQLDDGRSLDAVKLTFAFKSTPSFRADNFPRSAFLPNSENGLKILNLLQMAFAQ